VYFSMSCEYKGGWGIGVCGENIGGVLQKYRGDGERIGVCGENKGVCVEDIGGVTKV
jgi:hypothetical protein